MSDLRELYQQVILDHNKSPRNFGELEGSVRSASGTNPLCGDELRVFIDLAEDGTVRDVRFSGKGCAISTASASLMTESVKGQSTDFARTLFEKFHGILIGPADAPLDLDDLGKLAALAGVREFPMRVKCASLAWHTLRAALDGQEDPVTTE